MTNRDQVPGFDLLGGLAIFILAVVAIVGLLGFAVFDEGSETYGKIFGVPLGILVILAAAHFAMQGWSRLGRFLGSMSVQPQSADASDEPGEPPGS